MRHEFRNISLRFHSREKPQVDREIIYRFARKIPRDLLTPQLYRAVVTSEEKHPLSERLYYIPGFYIYIRLICINVAYVKSEGLICMFNLRPRTASNALSRLPSPVRFLSSRSRCSLDLEDEALRVP